MIFSSVQFLYWFLPIVILLYFAVPWKLKNAVLLLASLVFYFFGEPVYTFLMLGSAFIGYLHGLIIDKVRGTKWAKVALISSLVFGLGALGFFKYSNFFITNINDIFHSKIGLLSLSLPIGISFYTFQILSYTIDVYRGQAKVQKNPISFMAYVTLFPQLIAGPIVRYTDIAEQLKERVHRFDDIAYGIRRFIVGLSKKVLIANQLGELCDIFQSSGEQSVLFFWMYAVSVSLQIYFDFSGYSDMAIGLGRMFGFKFMENFNYPYISKSVTEFWRRWHISLGSWFRDYIYIPLGGNRVSKGRHLFNIFVVWFLTGFWHGAAWNFIIWGLYFAILLVFEKMYLLKKLENSKVLSRIYVLFTVLISFVIFNAPDMKTAFEDIGRLFGAGELPLTSTETMYYLKSYGVTIFVGIIGCMPVIPRIADRIMNWTQKKQSAGVNVAIYFVKTAVLITLVVLSTAYLVDGSFNPFLYFRF